ncbi:hypothetical protein GYM69_07440 [Lactobacillus panisapium]|uniref:hypothetical protein n=1 Tax=Lactobacillus panisapium TaxID=2012495 RepID=UPI001C6979FC|nr:hypothetical protein [Lactobacillus panisapium]QYN56960.1 hypothetical protein GYM69_07440 [Lactobacillus panisapium]
MRITEIAKNGQATMIYKSADELTTEEREMLILPCNMEMEDYADFQVRYNRKGQLLGVKGNAFSEAENEQINQESAKPDALDTCQLLFGNRHSKAYRLAKSKVKAASAEITAARKIVASK